MLTKWWCVYTAQDAVIVIGIVSSAEDPISELGQKNGIEKRTFSLVLIECSSGQVETAADDELPMCSAHKSE